MTFKVIVAIHYEAFKLWFKKVKLVKKINVLNKITFETMNINNISDKIISEC